MPSVGRWVSWVFWLVRRFDPSYWLLVLGLCALGLIRLRSGIDGALPWWIAASGIVLLSQIARAMGYVVFVPDDFRADAGSGRPPETRGVATGDFHTTGDALHNTPLSLWMVPVEVRPLRFSTPPGFVAAVPATHDAWAHWQSAWFPGSQATPGWVCLCGRAFPGLRLSFLGKRLLLGLESQELALAYLRDLSQ